MSGPVQSCVSRRDALRVALAAAAVWLLASLLPALAGLGPLDVLVVVNKNDRESVALGRHYLSAHGIPESHLLSLALPSGRHSIDPDVLENAIRHPVDDFLDASGLRPQIQAVVFCWQAPTRVGDNSLTAAYYYGHKPRAPDAPQCEIRDGSRNRYFLAERPYRASADYSSLHSPLPFVLTARTPDDARAAVDRAVQSLGSRPSGARFVLASSGDASRNVRARLHSLARDQFLRAGIGNSLQILPSAPDAPDGDVLLCSLGQAILPPAWPSNHFRLAPGAIGEHLTSCGGQLPDPCSSQASVWDWLAVGASASYGTVSEPCNFTAKFPHPAYAYFYARGFSAAEALWMGVENPYQGLMAGDPLAAPCAAPPSVALAPLPDDATDGKSTVLHVSVRAHPDGAPPVFLDLYIDGRHYTPMARPMAIGGNQIDLSVGSHRIRYTVQRNEDLYALAQSLAWAIAHDSHGAVQARAHGDSVSISVAGDSPLPVTVDVLPGLAPAVRLTASLPAGSSTVALGPELQGADIRLALGAASSYTLDYPIDLSFLSPGRHELAVVARDGSAVQAQALARASILIR